MKIGILSDTHDEIERVGRALAVFRSAGAERLIHCGDITHPETVRAFAGWTIDFVYGNCDWNEGGLEAAMESIRATNHGRWGHLEIEGTKLAFLHGDDERWMQELIDLKIYQFVFHGHTHTARDEVIGSTRVINPGALHRARRKSIVVLDLPTGEALSYEVA